MENSHELEKIGDVNHFDGLGIGVLLVGENR